jgi:hypothetical protein
MTDLNNLGTFDDIYAVWKIYPSGGLEGDYVTVAGTVLYWDRLHRKWIGEITTESGTGIKTVEGDLEVTGNATVDKKLTVVGDTSLQKATVKEAVIDTLEMEDPPYPTNAEFETLDESVSALKTEVGNLGSEVGGLGDCYLSKVAADTAAGVIDFTAGIKLNGVSAISMFARKDQSDTFAEDMYFTKDAHVSGTMYAATANATEVKATNGTFSNLLKAAACTIVGIAAVGTLEASTGLTSPAGTITTLGATTGNITTINAGTLNVTGTVTSLNLVIQNLAETYNLEVDHVATIVQVILTDYLSSSTFTTGFTGSGFRLWENEGFWNMELDTLTVRKVMNIFELIINKIRSVNGGLIISPGNGKIKTVTLADEVYTLEIEGDITFAAGDLVRCQTFRTTGSKYYWVPLVSVSDNNITVAASSFTSSLPEVGDELVQMGNSTDTDRQGALYLTAMEDGKPRIEVLNGIDSTDLTDKVKVILGCLDDITDSNFSDISGYGLYAQNAYLTGDFVLRSTGKSVETAVSDSATSTLASSESYTDTQISAVNGQITLKVTETKTYADTVASSAQSTAISTAASDATTKADAALSDAKSYVDSNYVTSSVYSSEITVLATSIASKVSQTDFDALDEVVSSNTSEITANATAITLKVSTTDYTGATIASLINESADTITISADHINLTGSSITIASSSDVSTSLTTAKSYASTQASSALSSAKSYANTQDATNLTTAKSYTDTKISVVNDSITSAITTTETYADTVSAAAVSTAATNAAELYVTQSTYSSYVSQTDKAIASKVSQTDFDALGVTVTSHTSTLSQLSDTIDARITSSVSTGGIVKTAVESWFTLSGNTLSLGATTIDISGATIFNSLATTGAVTTAIEAIKVGGTNRAFGTSTAVTAVGTNTNNQATGLYYLDENAFGQTVTVSFKWSYTGGSSSTASLYVQLNGPLYTGLSNSISLGTAASSGNSVLTVTIPAYANDRGFYVRTDYMDGTLTISNFKIELGNKATTWSPAPEDIATDLGYDSYDSMVADAVAGKTVIINGYINTDLIKAAVVVANGLSAQTINANSATITNVTVSGTIKASAGNVGAFTLDDNDLAYVDTDSVERVRISSSALTSLSTLITPVWETLSTVDVDSDSTSIITSSSAGVLTMKVSLDVTETIALSAENYIRFPAFTTGVNIGGTDVDDSVSAISIKLDGTYISSNTDYYLAKGNHTVEFLYSNTGTYTGYTANTSYSCYAYCKGTIQEMTNYVSKTVIGTDGMLSVLGVDKYLYFSKSYGYESRFGNYGLKLSTAGLQRWRVTNGTTAYTAGWTDLDNDFVSIIYASCTLTKDQKAIFVHATSDITLKLPADVEDGSLVGKKFKIRKCAAGNITLSINSTSSIHKILDNYNTTMDTRQIINGDCGVIEFDGIYWVFNYMSY